jgi:hypothetical protein
MTSMTEGPATACAETPQSPRRPARILRDLPQFRYLWLSKAISSTGNGIGRVALVLLVAPSGPGAVTLVLACTALPLLAGPLIALAGPRTAFVIAGAGSLAGAAVLIPVLPDRTGQTVVRPGRNGPKKCDRTDSGKKA